MDGASSPLSPRWCARIMVSEISDHLGGTAALSHGRGLASHSLRALSWDLFYFASSYHSAIIWLWSASGPKRSTARSTNCWTRCPMGVS